jgi:hypothetical protein
MSKTLFLLFLLTFTVINSSIAQKQKTGRFSFYTYDSIKITIDKPETVFKNKQTIISFFALPNGNSTAFTIGKKMQEGDDWHFDGQHIGAQTAFIRSKLPDQNFVVIYLENKYLSWPAWKRNNPAFMQIFPHLVDSLRNIIDGKEKLIYLNGHSGGGSFIFGYLASVEKIPSYVRRISFLDSDYGYDSSYYPKMKDWLVQVKGSALNVFAYNDSVVIYNGKPLVSPTGGTWYRSRLMMSHLQADFSFTKTRDDSIVIYKNKDERIQFFFRTNPDAKIYHTQQVGLNGFIHSTLCGTRRDSDGYIYYGDRVYEQWLE